MGGILAVFTLASPDRSTLPRVCAPCLFAPQDPIHRVGKGNSLKVHPRPYLLSIVVVHENRPASGPAAGLDIPPPVADKKAAAEIDVPIARRGQEHSRFRLPAFTLIGIVVVADADVVQRDPAAQETVDLLNRLTCQPPPRHLGLIRDDNEENPVPVQLDAGLGYAGDDFDFMQS